MAIHFALLPLTSVCPATLLALEGTLAILVAILKVTFIHIAINPLTLTLPVWITIEKFADIQLSLTHD